jgi:hypothetical protein
MAIDQMLSRLELNRALLARQLLLDRVHLSPERAVERVGGLQTQYAPSAYVGLWSRLAEFSRETLTDALRRREIVQGWMMRSTIHMVSAADYTPLTEAVRLPRRREFLRAWKNDAAELDMNAIAALTRLFLTGSPRRQADIVEHLSAHGYPKPAFPGVQLWLDLVRTPPAGTWELPRAHVYGLADDWLNHPRSAEITAAEDHLATRYLEGFGPASPGDLARYAGWTVTEARAVLNRLTLRRFRDPEGRELLDLPDAPRPTGDTPAPVRFLSTFDAALLLGHATRADVVPAEHRHRVFHTRMPQSVPTFLVDGRVAGTWRYTDGRVVPAAFEPLTSRADREVNDEAKRLTEFHQT